MEDEEKEDKGERSCACKICIDWKVAISKILSWIEKEAKKNGDSKILVSVHISVILDEIGIPLKLRKNIELRYFVSTFQKRMCEHGFFVRSYGKTIVIAKEQDDCVDMKRQLIENRVPRHVNIYKEKFGELIVDVKKELDKDKDEPIAAYMKDIRNLLGSNFDTFCDFTILRYVRIVMKEHGISVGIRCIDSKHIELVTFRYMKDKTPFWKRAGYSSEGEYKKFLSDYRNYDDKEHASYL